LCLDPALELRRFRGEQAIGGLAGDRNHGHFARREFIEQNVRTGRFHLGAIPALRQQEADAPGAAFDRQRQHWHRDRDLFAFTPFAEHVAGQQAETVAECPVARALLHGFDYRKRRISADLKSAVGQHAFVRRRFGGPLPEIDIGRTGGGGRRHARQYLAPTDLRHARAPPRRRIARAPPNCQLFAVIRDRSGPAYMIASIRKRAHHPAIP